MSRRKTCRYHCRGDSGHKGCSAHFSSLEAFDLHRQTDEEGRRVCVPPSAVVDEKGARLLVPQSQDGVCEICPPYPEGVAVWTTARSGRAAEAFRPPNALGPKPESVTQREVEGMDV